MAVEVFTYRQLGDRLGFSRDAARELVKRLRLPRHQAKDGKVLVYADLSEINPNLVPTQASAGQLPITSSLKEPIEPKLEASATSDQPDLERERERAERLVRAAFVRLSPLRVRQSESSV